MKTWSKRERVMAALAGEAPDRTPIALWGHFPSDPHHADDLAAATVAYQRQFDWDFVKLMPSGMYYPEALGCTLTPASGPSGANGLADSIVKRPEDWESLPIPSIDSGWLAEHVRSVRLVRDALGPDIPIIQTLFSPLTIAHKLSVHVPFEESTGSHRASLEAGLRSITEGTKRFAEASLDAGADGFFFATQEANYDTLTVADYQALAKPYDLDVLRAVADRASFLLLHVCRTNIMAEVVADYPAHAINWESHDAHPTLVEARRVWKQTIVGGLDRYGTLRNGTPDDVAAEVRGALEAAGPRRFIVSAGCGVVIGTPEANLLAARQAIEGI